MRDLKVGLFLMKWDVIRKKNILEFVWVMNYKELNIFFWMNVKRKELDILKYFLRGDEIIKVCVIYI